MENEKNTQITLESVQKAIQETNGELGVSFHDADEAMASAYCRYNEKLQSLIASAEHETAEDHNLLIAATKAAFEQKDRELSEKLLRFYAVFSDEKGENA